MTSHKKWVFSILLILAAVAFLSTLQPRTRKSQNQRQYENFSFRRIQAFLDDSARYFTAIDSIYKDLPSAESFYEILACKRGYYYTIKRDYKRSLQYSDSMLVTLKELTESPGYLYWSSKALFYKGDDLHALGNYGESFKYYFKAREAIFGTGDTCLFSDFSQRLAMVAYQQRHFGEAAEYFKQAFLQLSDCELGNDSANAHMSFAKKQSLLNNVGLCYSKLNITDSAICYFDSAQSFIHQNYQTAYKYTADNQKILDTDFVETALAVIYGNKAKDLITLGKYAEAENLLLQSIRLNRLPHHAPEDVPYSLAKLAGLYIKIGRSEEAKKILNQLKTELDDAPNAELLQRWHRLQSDFYGSKNNSTLALLHLQTYQALKDSAEVHSQILNTDIKKELVYLQNENQINVLKQEKKQRQVLMASAVTGLLLVTSLLGLIMKNYHQSKSHVVQLQELNRQIYQKKEYLNKTLADLQKSHDGNSRLMKIVAHDLRNPVGGIGGLTDILLKETNYTTMQREMLNMIQKSSNHAIELIQDLVHLHSSEKEITKEKMELSELLEHSIEMLQMKAAEKKQVINTNLMKVDLLGDKEKLWRVFSNLIGNAIKFSPISGEIKLNTEVNSDNVIISVHDNGIGIPESLQEKIFTSSGESKRKGTNGEPSFGLGLSICKQIVEAHRGKIWFSNNEASGTTFFVSLPLA